MLLDPDAPAGRTVPLAAANLAQEAGIAGMEQKTGFVEQQGEAWERGGKKKRGAHPSRRLPGRFLHLGANPRPPHGRSSKFGQARSLVYFKMS